VLWTGRNSHTNYYIGAVPCNDQGRDLPVSIGSEDDMTLQKVRRGESGMGNGNAVFSMVHICKQVMRRPDLVKCYVALC
jgi:hypothetical protein